jgi:hypothetical protein
MTKDEILEHVRFQDASQRLTACLALARDISKRLKAGEPVDEFAEAIRKHLVVVSPIMQHWIRRSIEANQQGEIDIGWGYTWRSAHEAARFIAEFAMLGGDDALKYTIEDEPYRSLLTRLSIERLKMSPVIPGRWVTKAEAARIYDLSKPEIKRRVDDNRLLSRGPKDGAETRVFVPAEFEA